MMDYESIYRVWVKLSSKYRDRFVDSGNLAELDCPWSGIPSEFYVITLVSDFAIRFVGSLCKDSDRDYESSFKC